jgi:copper chaperone
MTTVTYSVPNISCGHCVHTIQMEVGDMDGVESVVASADTKNVEIVFNAETNE